jgi:hypothetical protein
MNLRYWQPLRNLLLKIDKLLWNLGVEGWKVRERIGEYLFPDDMLIHINPEE